MRFGHLVALEFHQILHKIVALGISGEAVGGERIDGSHSEIWVDKGEARIGVIEEGGPFCIGKEIEWIEKGFSQTSTNLSEFVLTLRLT